MRARWSQARCASARLRRPRSMRDAGGRSCATTRPLIFCTRRCGGTHVENTADIGAAVIVSESSIGSGIRRIDMVVGEAADDMVIRDREMLSDLARSFNVTPEALPGRVQAVRAQLKETERERE